MNAHAIARLAPLALGAAALTASACDLGITTIDGVDYRVEYMTLQTANGPASIIVPDTGRVGQTAVFRFTAYRLDCARNVGISVSEAADGIEIEAHELIPVDQKSCGSRVPTVQYASTAPRIAGDRNVTVVGRSLPDDRVFRSIATIRVR